MLHKIKPYGKPYGKRCTCFAALGPRGLFHQYHESGDTSHMIEFVQDIYEEYGKILLIMDNAQYHKSKKLMEYIEGYGGDVQIVY